MFADYPPGNCSSYVSIGLNNGKKADIVALKTILRAAGIDSLDQLGMRFARNCGKGVCMLALLAPRLFVASPDPPPSPSCSWEFGRNASLRGRHLGDLSCVQQLLPRYRQLQVRVHMRGILQSRTT
ncbi:MAG: hypothetical protein EOO65_03305 [Methanosarcinales archaeon]|nr:MAG: hypothetical protein EOO65_03305 [Methanosarcinales archaeon]